MTKNMDIIEQAAKRLAELRRAGVELGTEPQAPSAVVTPAAVNTAAASVARVDANAMEATASLSRRVELDMARLTERGIVTPGAARSNLADELRVIKRPLLRNAAGKGATPVRNANLIMISSAVPGEGKSFTAANLAMSIATELEHTVLLVDADVARPSLPDIFGLPPGKGLLDVLVEPGLDLRQVMLRTNI